MMERKLKILQRILLSVILITELIHDRTVFGKEDPKMTPSSQETVFDIEMTPKEKELFVKDMNSGLLNHFLPEFPLVISSTAQPRFDDISESNCYTNGNLIFNLNRYSPELCKHLDTPSVCGLHTHRLLVLKRPVRTGESHETKRVIVM